MCMSYLFLYKTATEVKHISAVADGPARRAVSRASCCRQMWTLSVINWPQTVARVINLVRLTTVHYITLSEHSSKLTTNCDDRRAVAKFSKSKVCRKVPEYTFIFGDTRICLKTV